MKHRQPPSNEELLAAYGEYMSSIGLRADLIDLQLQVLRLFAEYLDQECTVTLGEYNRAEEVAFFRVRGVTLPWEKSNRGTVARATVRIFREWRRMSLKG